MGSEEVINCLLFDHQGALFAVRTEAVRQSIWLPELTVTEGMPGFVTGVFELHGTLVPVIDLNLRFGHTASPYRLADSVIVIVVDGGMVGLIVSEVLDVQDVRPIGLSCEPVEEDNRSLIQEVDVDGTIAMLLDHTRLMSADELLMASDQVSREGVVRLPFFPEASDEERRILHERAAALTGEVEHIDTEAHGLIVVTLANEYFGFDLEGVTEFANIGDVVPVPCCPPHIAGNMNLRGDIVTLVDMRSELHLPFSDDSSLAKVVISTKDQLLVGIPVDDIHEVIFVEPNQYKPVPSAVRKLADDYVRGEVAYAESMVTVIDLKAFFGRPELVVDLEV